jgi:hypothetical protein
MRERETRHGHNTRKGASPTYRSWNKMTDRCRNPNSNTFEHYGGRGITVCERWLLFDNFLADMGERPDGTTLDRIDPDGGYEPSNCRWATQRMQSANKRTAVWVIYKGERICLEHLAQKLGMAAPTLRRRIEAGWPEERWDAPSQVSPNHVSRSGARSLPLQTEVSRKSRLIETDVPGT